MKSNMILKLSFYICLNFATKRQREWIQELDFPLDLSMKKSLQHKTASIIHLLQETSDTTNVKSPRTDPLGENISKSKLKQYLVDKEKNKGRKNTYSRQLEVNDSLERIEMIAHLKDKKQVIDRQEHGKITTEKIPKSLKADYTPDFCMDYIYTPDFSFCTDEKAKYVCDNKISKYFGDSFWIYEYLHLKYEQFCQNESIFESMVVFDIFGEEFYLNFEEKDFILENKYKKSEIYIMVFRKYSEYFEHLIKFYSSNASIVEDFVPNFNKAYDIEIKSQEELIFKITEIISQILKDPMLINLKIYVPEFYGLENMPNELKFRNVRSAIIAYLVLFYMQFSTDINSEMFFDLKYRHILTIWQAPKFIHRVIGFGCLFQVFVLCLEQNMLHFSNSKHILGELIFFNSDYKYYGSIKQLDHYHNLFKKNLFFYFKGFITYGKKLVNNLKETYSFWRGSFKESQFLSIESLRILNELKKDFQLLRIRYLYINDIFIRLPVNLDTIETIFDMNRVLYTIFTLQPTHVNYFFRIIVIQKRYLKNIVKKVRQRKRIYIY